MSPHDFFFFVSKELKIGGPEPYISNTALLYAFNMIDKIRRNVAGVKPFYDCDRKFFTIYATPARIREEIMVIGNHICNKNHRIVSDLVKVTYNSVIESYITLMEQKGVVIPKLGFYMKYPPLTTFEFFILTRRNVRLPKVIRIGKKFPPARVYYEELQFEFKSGKFRPHHPVNILDLPKERTRILRGLFISMIPAPLLVDCLLEGKYIKARDKEGHNYNIAVPDEKRYPRVFGNAE